MKTTKIDMHSHTRGSDGVGTPAQIALAARKAGLDALCLTDHHTNLTEEVELVAEALRNVGVLPILGVEYSTADGHLLLFGVDVPAYAWGEYPPMQAVIDDVNALGGACVVPHAYKGYTRALRDKLKDIYGLAAVEVINGQVEQRDPPTNRKARDAATVMGARMCAGSDAHFPGDLGIVYTEFDGDIRTEDDFLAALKAGTFRPKVNAMAFLARGVAREATFATQRAAPKPAIPPPPTFVYKNWRTAEQESP